MCYVHVFSKNRIINVTLPHKGYKKKFTEDVTGGAGTA